MQKPEMGMVAAALLVAACSGGTGPLPNERGGSTSSSQTGGSQNGSGQTDNPTTSDQGNSDSTSTGNAGSSCTAAECPKLSCTCGTVKASVQQCVSGECATACEQAGCTP